MNKILTTALLLSASLCFTTSCVSEEDDIFDKSAAERLNETSSLYTARVLASEPGWAIEYYTTPEEITDKPTNNRLYFDRGYLMLAQFKPDMSVKVGMKNVFSNNVYGEDLSLWQVLTDNGPVLSFNSYNKMLHAFSLPEDLPMTGTTNNPVNEQGRGLEGDYEFVMVDVPENGDHILLKGKKRGSYSRMTRLSAGTDFNEYLTDVEAFKNAHFASSMPNGFRMFVGGTQYNVLEAYRGVAKYWEEGTDSNFTMKYNPYLITRHVAENNDTTYAFRFRDAVASADGKTTEQEFSIAKHGDNFYGKTNTANVLCSPVVNDVFTSILAEVNNPRGWVTDSTYIAGGALKTTIDAMVAQAYGMKNKYVFNKFYFKNVKDVPTFEIIFTYQNNRKQTVTAKASYIFNIEKDGENIKLTYVEPADAAAGTLLNTLTGVKAVLESLNGTFTIKCYKNEFDGRNLKLSPVEDPSSYLVFNYAQ